MNMMLEKKVYSPIRNIVALTFIISGCSGLFRATFNYFDYTFHENSSKGRNWAQSRWLCHNSSEGDLVSIEEENEWIFVESIIKNLTAAKYFVGLKKEQHSGKWKWLAIGKSVDASQGSHPWAPGQPSGGSDTKCATIYGNYRSYLGLFDDLGCLQRSKGAGYICERAVSFTKYEKAELTTAYKDAKRHPTTQSSPVSSTTQSEMTSNQPRGTSSRKELTEAKTPVSSSIISQENGAEHHFTELEGCGAISHVRLTIYPDGGVCRFRCWGVPALYNPQNDSDPEMIPISRLVDPEMIPKELRNGRSLSLGNDDQT